MAIEGIGLGSGPIRPKSTGSGASRRADSEMDPAAAPEAVGRTGDRVDLSERAIRQADQLSARSNPNDDSGTLDEARIQDIRERLASGFYETAEVLEAILSGIEAEEPKLFL